MTTSEGGGFYTDNFLVRKVYSFVTFWYQHQAYKCTRTCLVTTVTYLKSLWYLDCLTLFTFKTSTHYVYHILSIDVTIHTSMLHHQTCFVHGVRSTLSNRVSLKAIRLCPPADFCCKIANCFHSFSILHWCFLHDLSPSQRFCLFSREGSMHILRSFCCCRSHGSFPSLCQKSSVFFGLCKRAESMSSTRSVFVHAVL